MPIKFTDLLRKWHNGALHGAQIDLARKIGISQSAISQWVNGYYEPEEDMLEKLAKEFKLSIDEVKSSFLENSTPREVKTRLHDHKAIDAKPIPVYGIMTGDVFKIPQLNNITLAPEEYVPIPISSSGSMFALKSRGQRKLPIVVEVNEYIVFAEANEDDVNDGDAVLHRVGQGEFAFDSFNKHKPGSVVGKYVGVFRR